MDISRIINGDNINRGTSLFPLILDTKAIGVIYIIIHRAHGLKKADNNGKSDPYITVALSKYAKPMYSTRIIQKCLEPTFEETCAILITPEHIKANESLRLQLWDSDRFSADDLLGKVEVDVNDLLRKAKNGEMEMEERSDDLVGFDSEKPEPGKLFWSGKLREKVIDLVMVYFPRTMDCLILYSGLVYY